ncbi:trypsin [Amycolatopsis sulphurea]|uniref:Trypsin n=1 Tax=Amycolatopsis sulphurea TaxID=76022 RepID=A0A2A9F5S5_9PSEU|nr:trypsin-like serine protease [Amycolatopsis sulphurea]PFG46518.1 trypsin [Amycolatopsis sulphurea]
MRLARTVAVVVGAAAALGLGVSAPAAADEPMIIGGTTVDSAPWGAQVFWDDQTEYGGFACSGTIVASQWVLTAQHCLNKPGMHVKVGDVALGKGKEVAVDQQQASPNGDIALLHLKSAVDTTFMKLADADPDNGATNQIYGWGRVQGNSPPSDTLKTADVKVTGDSTDAFDGKAIASKGVTGSSWHGDSGGPQLSDGVQVGVCSTGVNSGSDKNGTQNYASVANSRDWIKKTAGV